MDRRRLLGLLSAVTSVGLGGCSERPLRAGGSPSGDQPTLAVESVTQPAVGEFAVAVSRQASERRPPAISVRFTATGTTPTQFQFGTAPPFSAAWSAADTLVLIPGDVESSGDTVYVDTSYVDQGDPSPLGLTLERADGCWYTTDDHVRTAELVTVELAAGESINQQYVVAATTEDAACATGSYQFRTDELQIRTDTGSSRATDPYGFTLTHR